MLGAGDLVPGSYTLGVTSPGVDRTLGREKDFARSVGRRVEVVTRVPLSGRRRFRGRLLAFDHARDPTTGSALLEESQQVIEEPLPSTCPD